VAETSLKHITDIMPYFKHDPKKKTLTFIGKSLRAVIPKRYETYGLMSVTNTVQTIGIMDLIIDEKFNAHLHLMGLIEMDPSDISSETIDGIEYLALTFTSGDLFLTNTTIVKNQALIYAIYTEFVDRGKMIYTMGYEDLIWLFDSAKEMCDAALPMDHAMFEVIYAHLARKADDKFVPYRYTDMKGDFSFIPLRDVSFAPNSTTARLMGSYFSDSTLASLLNENETRRNFEDLLRGAPTEKAQTKYD